MNGILKSIFASMAICAAVIGCEKGPQGYTVDEEAVVLEAYGPNPVLRGAELKFIGQNLDKIQAVILPVDVEIPASEFIDADASSFKVIVPMECEPGSVELVYPGGTITAKTELSYTEQYEISAIYPQEEGKELLEAGDSLVVDGEYLNNIVKFVFAGGAVSEGDLIGTHTRHKVVFAVPAGALSGRIYAEDGNGNQIYSEGEILISQPAVGAITPLDVRPGETVTISGALLDQVVSVKFSGSSLKIEQSDYLSASKTEIEVLVPADVHDGPVTLVSAASQEIVSEDEIVVKVPGNISVSAERFKAGEALTVSGDDLDLVVGLKFADNVDSEFEFVEGSIVTTIPASAKDGTLVLTTAADKSVETPAVEFVKPVVSSVSVSEIVAGAPFDIEGSDLNLVTKVTLNHQECAFEFSEDRLVVATEKNASTGKVEIFTANGTVIEALAEMTVTYDALVFVSEITSEVKVGDVVTMKGTGFNLVEAIWFGDVKVTSYSLRTDTQMAFVVPAVEGGSYNLTFVLTTGEEEECVYPVNVIAGTLVTEVLWEGENDLGDWSNSLSLENAFRNLQYGSVLYVEYIAQEGAQMKFADLTNGWADMPGINGGSITELDPNANIVSYALPDATVDILKSAGTVIQGKLAVITKVYVTYMTGGDSGESLPEVVMINDFEQHGDHNASWDGSWAGNASAETGADGNTYLKVTSDATGWVINCNHKAFVDVIEDISRYDLAIDVLVPEGWSDTGAIYYKLVIGGGWYDYGHNMFKDAVGNGQWQTLTIDISALNISSPVDLAADTNGLYIDNAGFPVGMCFDNMRLVLKK